jgi:hypothetical protein
MAYFIPSFMIYRSSVLAHCDTQQQQQRQPQPAVDGRRKRNVIVCVRVRSFSSHTNKPINMKINDWRWFAAFGFVRRLLLLLSHNDPPPPTMDNQLIENSPLSLQQIYNFERCRVST